MTNKANKYIVIKTKNFYLRPFHKEDDFNLSYNLWNDKDVFELMKRKPCNKKDIEEKLSRYKLWVDKLGFTNFAVFTKETEDFVGSCLCFIMLMVREIRLGQ